VAVPALEEWTGRDVTIREIERELARLRHSSAEQSQGPDLRTSVMTHMAWVPDEWVEAAHTTLAGLAERHPSRTIILIPAPEKESGLDAELSLRCFPLRTGPGNVCSEVIELRLRGDRARAPASIVMPLLISDLPAFLRWRGEPPFGDPEFQQLVEVADRLVLDSAEWPGLPEAYAKLVEIFEETAVSDIAWGRTLMWRDALAQLWPDIAAPKQLHVEGPHADALLLVGWLRSRLGSEIGLSHAMAAAVEAVTVDERQVPRPRAPQPTPSELLSNELDRFSRDRIYEEAVGSADR
jgi:glucose-6-phosphate dehydrogenase assembly protein OpcA